MSNSMIFVRAACGIVVLFASSVVLVGCASTREERVAAIQSELPQLVTACNGAFRDGSSMGLGIVAIDQGIEACDRLAFARSLDEVRPATAELYQHYKRRGHDTSAFPIPFGSGGNSPSSDVGVQAWAPGMPLPTVN